MHVKSHHDAQTRDGFATGRRQRWHTPADADTVVPAANPSDSSPTTTIVGSAPASVSPEPAIVTPGPVTAAPVTAAPVTAIPVTPAPIAAAPVTAAPVTTAPLATPAAAGAATTPATLTRHDGTIYAQSGDVIQNLDIYTDGVGIELENDDNVTISNVRIHYNSANKGGAGISGVDADNLKINGVELIDAGAPASGPNSDAEQYGIGLFKSPGAAISHVTVRDASTGIYLQDSPQAVLEGIEGYNMRGPFPRGQLVQFNRSGNSSLTDFYAYDNLETSWTEDNINIGDSNGVTVSNGLIDGNNSPSGVGVITENSTGVTVRNVDTVHMGNGAFSDYGSGNTFDHVRSFDNFVSSHAGRGTPLSGGLIFGLADDTTITNAAYQNPANPNNIVYGGGIQDDAFKGTFSATQITGQTPMAAWHNTFSWS